MHPLRIVGAVVLAAGLAAGCSVTSPSDLTQQTFTGTVSPGGNAQFVFTQNKTGEFIAKLTAIAPDSGATLGGQYGSPVSNGCAVIGNNPLGGVNTEFFDITLPAGSYCFQVYDSGTLPRAQTFTLLIEHS